MRTINAIASLGLIVALGTYGAVGCAPAKAEPLEVTYYYLPG